MGAERNKDVANDYENYIKNMRSLKQACDKLIVSHIKPHHPDAYIEESNIQCDPPLGNTYQKAEIKGFDAYYYTFAYLSDKYANRMLARLDVGGPPHKNMAPDIPLEETNVLSPHFHECRSDGYMIAYKIDGVNYESEQSTQIGYEKGYEYFCTKLNIINTKGEIPTFIFRPDGILPLGNDIADPNMGIDFKEID